MRIYLLFVILALTLAGCTGPDMLSTTDSLEQVNNSFEPVNIKTDFYEVSYLNPNPDSNYSNIHHNDVGYLTKYFDVNVIMLMPFEYEGQKNLKIQLKGFYLGSARSDFRSIFPQRVNHTINHLDVSSIDPNKYNWYNSDKYEYMFIAEKFPISDLTAQISREIQSDTEYTYDDCFKKELPGWSLLFFTKKSWYSHSQPYENQVLFFFNDTTGYKILLKDDEKHVGGLDEFIGDSGKMPDLVDTSPYCVGLLSSPDFARAVERINQPQPITYKSVCPEVEESYFREVCYTLEAQKYNNISICNNIKEHELSNEDSYFDIYLSNYGQCITLLAKQRVDILVCDLIKPGSVRDWCIKAFDKEVAKIVFDNVKQTGDSRLCEKLKRVDFLTCVRDLTPKNNLSIGVRACLEYNFSDPKPAPGVVKNHTSRSGCIRQIIEWNVFDTDIEFCLKKHNSTFEQEECILKNDVYD